MSHPQIDKQVKMLYINDKAMQQLHWFATMQQNKKKQPLIFYSLKNKSKSMNIVVDCWLCCVLNCRDIFLELKPLVIIYLWNKWNSFLPEWLLA